MIENKNNKESIVDFHFKEYEFLRDEIMITLKEVRSLPRYVIIGTGAVWVWLLTHDNTDINKIGYWLPFLFAILGIIRTIWLLTGIKRIAEYIRKFENIICKDDQLPGWETYIKNQRPSLFNFSGAFFWAITLAITFLVPFLFNK